MTGFCSGSADSTPAFVEVRLNVVTGGTSVDHTLVGTLQDGSAPTYLFSDDTRLYADRGTKITVDMTSIPPADDNRLCRLAFSGQLVR